MLSLTTIGSNRRYTGSVELFDRNDENTLWHRVFYNDSERIEIEQNLKLVYNLLYSDGSSSNLNDLEIDSVDFCTFGNSNPFRVKVKNKLNDNFTYYYIKIADSSRIYGLELEHIQHILGKRNASLSTISEKVEEEQKSPEETEEDETPNNTKRLLLYDILNTQIELWLRVECHVKT